MKPADYSLLVVDDNEDNRYTLLHRLKRLGYTNVATAVDGRQALDLLGSQRFDLVLMRRWRVHIGNPGIERR